MATSNVTEITPAGRLSTEAQKNVVEFFNRIADAHSQSHELVNKMDAIDVAYARYQEFSNKQLIVDGVDVRRDADTACDVFSDDNVIPPIVVSQVDSYVGYLADVFLSGTPIFPVVSNPSNKMYAEQLETLLDDHASLGGYVRQLALFLRDGVKYNYSGIECDWSEIEQFQVADAFEESRDRKVNRASKKFTRIRRLNPRNIFRDATVAPGDVAELGDYVGYVEKITRMKLKKELNALTKEGQVYNADTAMMSTAASYGTSTTSIYHDDPQISDYITQLKGQKGVVDWNVWLDGKKSRSTMSYGQTYERSVLYARILPADFGITAPAKNTPQIWKFVIINGSIVIAAKRIISAYDYLPILLGQPLEDGLGYQTQSVGESEMPFQKAAATLFGIRFSSARRAVSDRAIYDESALKSEHVNSPTAAPKIPAKISSLANKKLSDLYYAIPYDPRGTESAMQDAQMIVQFSKELHGMNSPRQGQFQKGNKSVTEWEDTMGGSDQRLRMPALVLEHQVFGPLKSILVLNIYQYGSDSVVVSQKNGNTIKIDLNKLREQVLAFRIADGYTPKSKIASVQMITTGLQMISTSQILQQAYGQSLPGMFAHLMQLGGVRGLEEYDPNYQASPVAPAPPDPLQAMGAAAPAQNGNPLDVPAPSWGQALLPGSASALSQPVTPPAPGGGNLP